MRAFIPMLLFACIAVLFVQPTLQSYVGYVNCGGHIFIIPQSKTPQNEAESVCRKHGLQLAMFLNKNVMDIGQSLVSCGQLGLLTPGQLYMITSRQNNNCTYLKVSDDENGFIQEGFETSDNCSTSSYLICDAKHIWPSFEEWFQIQNQDESLFRISQEQTNCTECLSKCQKASPGTLTSFSDPIAKGILQTGATFLTSVGLHMWMKSSNDQCTLVNGTLHEVIDTSAKHLELPAHCVCQKSIPKSLPTQGRVTSNAVTTHFPHTTDKLTFDKLTTDRLTTHKLITHKLTTNKVTTDKLTSDKLTTDNLTTDKLSTDTLTTDKLTTDKLTTDKLTTDNLTTDKLTTDKLTTDKLATDKLTTDKLTTDELTTDNLTTDKLTTDKLTTDKLTIDELTTDNLTTDKLTTDKLTTDKLTTVKLTTDKLTSDELTTDELTTDELTTDNLITDKLTTDKLTTDKLTTDNLATDKLTTDKLTTDTLTTDELTTDKLTTDKLTTDKPTADMLTTDMLTTDKLTIDKLTTDTLTTDKLTNHTSSWLTVDLYEYLVPKERLNHSAAVSFCSHFNATFMTFTSILRYFQMIELLSISKDRFWINDQNISSTQCLTMDTDLRHLGTSDCAHEFPFVCSRFIYHNNPSQVLSDPSFVSMIKEMTVEKNATSKAARILTSARDNRLVAKTSGGVAIALVSGVLIFLVFSDISMAVLKCVQVLRFLFGDAYVESVVI